MTKRSNGGQSKSTLHLAGWGRFYKRWYSINYFYKYFLKFSVALTFIIVVFIYVFSLNRVFLLANYKIATNQCVHAKSLHTCLTLCDPMDSSTPGSSVHGILPPGKNTGVGCHFLLQGIFPTLSQADTICQTLCVSHALFCL